MYECTLLWRIRIIALLCIQCLWWSDGTSQIHIRGSNKFFPCSYRREIGGYGIVCDYSASRNFSEKLPIIVSDGVIVKSVLFIGHSGIRTCEANTFHKANAQTQAPIRQIAIFNTSLHVFQPGCFNGLRNLEELTIHNNENDHGGHGENLLHELRVLISLKRLHLLNLNLSEKIPANSFGQWASNIRAIWLSNNQLREIHDHAFNMSQSALGEIRLVRQTEGWSLLENAYRWAASLTTMRTINMTGTPIHQPPQGSTPLDFGERVNGMVRTLVLNNCSLVKLCDSMDVDHCEGLRIHTTLAISLEQIYVDHNRFHTIGPHQSSLDGLKRMIHLKKLSLRYNQIPLYTVPEWSELENLEELYIERAGIKYLGPTAFPDSVQVLQISSNPLRYVDPKWMSNIRQLRELYMNHVRLDGVNIGGKRGAWEQALKPVSQSLRVLSLARCQLRSDMFGLMSTNPVNGFSKPVIDLNMFRQLRMLILDGNNLTYIPFNMINQLDRLVNISLARNQLSTVKTVGILHANQSSRQRFLQIDVRYNRLKTLERCEASLGFTQFLDKLLPSDSPEEDNGNLRGMTGARVPILLGLRGNPMVCDCRLAWLSRWVKQLRNSSKAIPSAMDFTCFDRGRWKERRFLSLRPEDLYAVDHAECRQRPEVYGHPLTPNAALLPCQPRKITLLNEGADRLRMMPTKQDKVVVASKPRRSALTTTAFILLIIAGIVSLLFIIISTIIIIRLCLQSRRKKRAGRKDPARKTLCRCCVRGGYETHASQLNVGSHIVDTATMNSTQRRSADWKSGVVADIPRGRIFAPHGKVYVRGLGQAKGDEAKWLLRKQQVANQSNADHREKFESHPEVEWICPSPRSSTLGDRKTQSEADLKIPVTTATEKISLSQSAIDQLSRKPRVTPDEYQRILPWRYQEKRHMHGGLHLTDLHGRWFTRSNPTTDTRQPIKLRNKKRSFKNVVLPEMGRKFHCYKRKRHRHDESEARTSTHEDMNEPSGRRTHGASLPRPQFIVIPNDATIADPEITNYLQMAEQGQQHSDTNQSKPSIVDEYIQPTEAHAILNLASSNDNKLRRRPSKSAENLVHTVTRGQNKLRLSENLYLLPCDADNLSKRLNDYSDLPLPPPPPPPPLLDTKTLLKIRNKNREGNAARLPPLATVSHRNVPKTQNRTTQPFLPSRSEPPVDHEITE